MVVVIGTTQLQFTTVVHVPCQKERKTIDLMARNLSTGWYFESRALVAA